MTWSWIKEGLRAGLCRVALPKHAGQVAADHGQRWQGFVLPIEGMSAVVRCGSLRRRGSAQWGLGEMLGTAFGTVPERLGHPAFRRDGPDLPPQFRDGPSTRRCREHGDRPDPPPCCRPRNPPCVTTLDAGPYVLPGLPWPTHTRSLEAPVIEVKDLTCRSDRPDGC